MLMEQCKNKIEELGTGAPFSEHPRYHVPGELKNVFAQVVKARKGPCRAGARRGETAALRNLANAAKLMENNPALMQLRIIQSLGGSSGSTIVMGLPQDAALSAIQKRTSKDDTVE